MLRLLQFTFVINAQYCGDISHLCLVLKSSKFGTCFTVTADPNLESLYLKCSIAVTG